MLNAALRTIIVLTLLLTGGMATLAADGQPAAIIAHLNDALIETMKRSDRLDAKGRYEALAPAVDATYDFQRMVAIVAGGAWGHGSEAEQRALIQAFRRFTIANYAARFKDYAGEQFEMLGERPAARERLVVETRLLRGDGPPVSINYVFELREDRWRAIDVLAERAISELALRRSEFAQTLKDGGLPALTALLHQKSDEMLAN